MIPRLHPALSFILALAAGLLLPGCSTSRSVKPPLPLATNVNLPRFMGDWHVIANIPTFIERDAHDAVTQAEWRMQFLWPFKAAYLSPTLPTHARCVHSPW